MIDLSNEKLPYLFPPAPRKVLSGVDRYLLTLDAAFAGGLPRIENRDKDESHAKADKADKGTAGFEKRRGPKIFNRLPLSVRLLNGYVREILTLRRRFILGKTSERSFIHVNMVGCEVQTIAAKLAGFRAVVTTVHNLPGEDDAGKYWLRRCIEWLSFAFADHHICVSEATFDAWKNRVGLRRDQVTIIYNGMTEPDYSCFDREAYRRSLLPNYADAVWVGMCARLHPMKGHSVLLEAWAALESEGACRDKVLILAGSGPLDAELKKQAHQLGIENSVFFLGHRTDALEFARAIDLNVLPSVHSETLGYGLIEAMFAGRPSVVSDVGGMKELVALSKGGKVVPARDVLALAQAFAEYFRAPETMRADGLRARCFAREHLTAQKMAEATSRVYASFK